MKSLVAAVNDDFKDITDKLTKFCDDKGGQACIADVPWTDEERERLKEWAKTLSLS